MLRQKHYELMGLIVIFIGGIAFFSLINGDIPLLRPDFWDNKPFTQNISSPWDAGGWQPGSNEHVYMIDEKNLVIVMQLQPDQSPRLSWVPQKSHNGPMYGEWFFGEDNWSRRINVSDGNRYVRIEPDGKVRTKSLTPEEYLAIREFFDEFGFNPRSKIKTSLDQMLHEQGLVRGDALESITHDFAQMLISIRNHFFELSMNDEGGDENIP